VLGVADVPLSDPELPALPALLGPAAMDVLEAAVADAGGHIRAAQPEHASYRVGRRILVAYGAEVAWPDGTVTDETIVALGRTREPPRGSLPVEVGGATVGVWRLPKDPYLPGLERALDHGFVRSLLDDLGAPAGPIDITMRGYWPRDRSVIEVTTATPRMKLRFTPGQGLANAPPTRLLYLKVVDPDHGPALYDAHSRLSGELPVPACHRFFEDDGILVLEARPGRPLYDWVQEGATPVPGSEELLGLLDRLAEQPFDVERAETVREVAWRYAPMFRALVPDQEARIDSVLERLGEDTDEPLVTTHNDFHEYQVLVESGQISGFLDVDEVAPGQRLDDLAMMVARFLSFAPFEQSGRERLESYAYGLLRDFGRTVDPEELHKRIAAVMFARATSPFRNQEGNWRKGIRHLIGVADEWLDRPVGSYD
jgi:hypothetical protein